MRDKPRDCNRGIRCKERLQGRDLYNKCDTCEPRARTEDPGARGLIARRQDAIPGLAKAMLKDKEREQEQKRESKESTSGEQFPELVLSEQYLNQSTGKGRNPDRRHKHSKRDSHRETSAAPAAQSHRSSGSEMASPVLSRSRNSKDDKTGNGRKKSRDARDRNANPLRHEHRIDPKTKIPNQPSTPRDPGSVANGRLAEFAIPPKPQPMGKHVPDGSRSSLDPDDGSAEASLQAPRQPNSQKYTLSQSGRETPDAIEPQQLINDVSSSFSSESDGGSDDELEALSGSTIIDTGDAGYEAMKSDEGGKWPPHEASDY